MGDKPLNDLTLPETIRITDDGFLEIFGGATGLPEDAPYDWAMERLESGPGLASYLRQISQKSWAHPALMRELIATVADWFDSAIEREMMQEANSPEGSCS